MESDARDTKLPGSSRSKKKKKPTLRFELDLPESTDTSFPEYSYVDLVRKTLKDKKSKGENDSMCQDLLAEEEEKEKSEAEALAQYYEIKYCANVVAGQKRKRKDELRDLIDVGHGYDETDPFVDDSEAYDEVVPSTLTTQHGGFYINTGRLEFRRVSDKSESDDTSSDDSVPLSHHVAKKKTKKANFLDTDESGDEFRKQYGAEHKNKKKKIKSSNDHVHKKKRKISLNGKDKLSKLNQSTKKMKKSSTSYAQKLVAKAKAQQMMNVSSAASPAHSTNGGNMPYRKHSTDDHTAAKYRLGEVGHNLENIHNKDLARVAKQATKDLMNIGNTKLNYHSGIEGVSSNAGTAKTLLSPESIELPPNLPQVLGDKIESLKKIAKSAEGEGKQKFFSSDVNRILLGIDDGSHNLRTKERQGMYQHIADHLPCSKETLMKRVKKLQVNNCDQEIKIALSRLREGINTVMTAQIQEYDLACSLQQAQSGGRLSSNPAAASTDEDEECEDKTGPVPSEGGDGPGEKVKRTYAPRRKFKWNDELRKLLCNVVAVKVNHYEKFKFREKQIPQEYLKAFLEESVKPLWPKTWMQTRILFKESLPAHSHLTLSNSCQKQKKVLANKKIFSGKKTSDCSPNQRNTKSSFSVAPDGQCPSAPAKTSKKQLTYGSVVSNGCQPLTASMQSLGTTGFQCRASALGEDQELNDLIKTANSGCELVSIKSEASPTSSPIILKSVSREIGGNSVILPSNKDTKTGAQRIEKKAKSKDKESTKTQTKAREISPNQPSSSRKEDPYEAYASEMLKFLMGSADPSMFTQGMTPGFAGSSTIPPLNMDVMSVLQGLKPEDMMGKKKASSDDEKFQFKIKSQASPFNAMPVSNTMNLMKMASTGPDITGKSRGNEQLFHYGEKSKHSVTNVAIPPGDIRCPTFAGVELKLQTRKVLPTSVSDARLNSSLHTASRSFTSPKDSSSVMHSSHSKHFVSNSSISSIQNFAIPDPQISKYSSQQVCSNSNLRPVEKQTTVSSSSFQLKVGNSSANSHSVPSSPTPCSPLGSFQPKQTSSKNHTLSNQTHLSMCHQPVSQINLSHSTYLPPRTLPISRKTQAHGDKNTIRNFAPNQGHFRSTSSNPNFLSPENKLHPANTTHGMYLTKESLSQSQILHPSHVHNFPQVKIIDIQGEKDVFNPQTVQHVGLKGNHNR